MTAEDRSPEDVRREIEQTREQLAETAAALAEKADVKARAHDRVEGVKADVRQRVDHVKAAVTDKAHAAREAVTPDGDGDGTAEPRVAAVTSTVRDAASSAAESARSSRVPWPVVAAALLGVSIGYLLARRRY